MTSTSFLRLVHSPVKFRLYLLSKLPSAFFSGVRVREADEDHCVVSVPYKWFSQNPFRSTYFACLAMAAEMSTGLLSMVHVYGQKSPVSMLVVGLEASYFKKATGKTYFTCSDGPIIREAMEAAVATGEPRTIRARSEGVNDRGEAVAEFFIIWSFKVRTK